MSVKHYVGCISGTSVDALDLALLRVDDADQIKIVHAHTAKLPADLRLRLLALGQPGNDSLDEFGQCDAELGILIGHEVLNFLARIAIEKDAIAAIGSHGQTVRHRPPTEKRSATTAFTLQIGDANRIAEITGIATVADFRRRDVAAGGHGAPLVPPFHQALFAHIGEQPVALNIGGISNLSFLGRPPSGFDSGPGNCLMDSWCHTHTGKVYDENGEWARTGKIDHPLLERLLEDPYFALSPPKSTGREYFNLVWLEGHLSGVAASPADVQRTLCELTARTIADALENLDYSLSHLIVCGGGRHNGLLMQRLAEVTRCEVGASERWGVDGDAIEAAAFAWLAHRTCSHLPGNEPAVTGAAGYRVLGSFHPGRSSAPGTD